MTVKEALKKTGWEACKNTQLEVWEVDQLFADDPEWINQPGVYNTEYDCVVCEDGDELDEGKEA